jgi:hypothetical protein
VNLWLFGLVFVLGGIAGVVLIIMPLSRNSNLAKPGTFKIKKHLYTYEVGDMLIRFVGEDVYSGMDIHLAKRLPHIFLNAYVAEDGVSQEGYVFADDERVYFKHDINKHLQVYATKGYESMAHKIFSTDILDALVDAKYRYNIEIMDRHVRLIVPSDVPVVGANQDMQHDILHLSKRLVEQVDSVLENWDESRLEQATNRD